VQLFEWFGRTLAPPALAFERHGSPRWLTVLAYHRVVPAPAEDYWFDRDVLDCDPDRFEKHMGLLARRCTPIGLDRLLRFLDGEPLPPNPVLVTFDDGYRDNRDHALPILQRHQIPALFFVASSYVADRRVFWWDRLAYLFSRTSAPVARLAYPTDLVLRPRTEPERARRMALGIIKTCPGLDLEQFLSDLGRALQVPWDRALEEEFADELVMTWSDVRDLVDAGMEIGSHTRTHRVLHTLAADELSAELTGSRAEIERATGRPVRSISYPVGRSLRLVPPLLRAVRDAGYRAGFSAVPRAIPVRGTVDPYDLGRLSVDQRITRDHLAALLAAPELSRAW
jgi:peptidoglycan/xylan/chitin deacetylase (PgdA/CDA1 family)